MIHHNTINENQQFNRAIQELFYWISKYPAQPLSERVEWFERRLNGMPFENHKRVDTMERGLKNYDVGCMNKEPEDLFLNYNV